MSSGRKKSTRISKDAKTTTVAEKHATDSPASEQPERQCVQQLQERRVQSQKRSVCMSQGRHTQSQESHVELLKSCEQPPERRREQQPVRRSERLSKRSCGANVPEIAIKEEETQDVANIEKEGDNDSNVIFPTQQTMYPHLISQGFEAAVCSEAETSCPPIQTDASESDKGDNSDDFDHLTELFSSLKISDAFDVPKEGSGETLCDIRNWNLPPSVVQGYVDHGITEMFPWQVKCLIAPGVLDGKNLVYSAPTSSGKTLVAEVLMMKKILECQKKGVMVLPYVSLVREKVKYFKNLFRGAAIKVDGFMGQYYPPGGFESLDLAVCTIEKASGIVNRLIEQGSLEELGVLIIDELHMIGEQGRGHTLELLISKILFVTKMKNINLQIIGMSATLPNLECFETWLNAVGFRVDYRPVPLKERMKIGGVIFDADTGSVIRDMRTVQNPVKNDKDHVICLSLETVLSGYSVLIFCPSKEWCENLAVRIAKEIYDIGAGRTEIKGAPSAEYCDWHNACAKLREILKEDSLKVITDQLERCPAGLDQQLAATVSFGVAYHHAGLTYDERDIIEDSFRQGIVKVLTATSTLASGVNLPARRVIIRSPLFMGKVMDITSYKQMAGRAGRKGIDSEGESILICKSEERHYANILKSKELHYISSCLLTEDTMQRAVLEVIACGAAKTTEDAELYLGCTFLFSLGIKCHDQDSSERIRKISKIVDECLSSLTAMQFIFVQEESSDGVAKKNYYPTQLGKAALAAAFSPQAALRVLKELETARQGFVLENDLHILYEVTPMFISDQLGKIDYSIYSSLWGKLSDDKKRVAAKVGVEEGFIDHCRSGRFLASSVKLKSKMDIHKRFFASLALNELIEEIPIDVVEKQFGCSRGILQSLQQNTAVFAGMLKEFCRLLRWHNLELLFSSYQNRLHFGVMPELCNLVLLKTVDARTARVIFDGGYTTVQEIARANPEYLALLLHNSTAFKGLFMKNEEVQLPGFPVLHVKTAAALIIKEAQEYVESDIGQKFLWYAASDSSCHKSTKNSGITFHSQKETKSYAANSGESVCKSYLTGISILQDGQSLPKESTPKVQSVVRFFGDHTGIGNLSEIRSSESPESVSNRTETFSSLLADCIPPTPQKVIISRKSSGNFVEPLVTDFSEFVTPPISKKHTPYNVKDDIDVTEFLGKLEKEKKFSLSLACVTSSLAQGIGPDIAGSSCQPVALPDSVDSVAVGIAVCFGSDVYYLEFSGVDEVHSNERSLGVQQKIKLIKNFIENNLKGKEVTICDIMAHYCTLNKCCGISLPYDGNILYSDPWIADWMLHRSKKICKPPSLHSLVNKYLYLSETASETKAFKSCPGSIALSTSCDYPAKHRAVTEAFVAYHLMNEITNNLSWKNRKNLRRIEMRCAIILAKRDSRGIGCDNQTLDIYCRELLESLSTLRNKMAELAGYPFNPDSCYDVCKVLFSTLKLSAASCVPGADGNILMNKCNLKRLSALHPLPGMISTFRKVNYAYNHISRHIRKSLKYSDELKMHRIHGSSNMYTSTGRVCITSPPLQQTPSDNFFHDVNFDGYEKLNKINIRNIFIPCRGSIFLSADYKAMELRIMAHLSDDKNLIESLNCGADVFEKLILLWKSTTVCESDAHARQEIKKMVYAFMYGMSVQRISVEINRPVCEVELFFKQFGREYPKLLKYKEDLPEKYDNSNRISRIGTLDVSISQILPQNLKGSNSSGFILSHVVQSFASHVFKTAILSVNEEIQKKNSSDAHLVLHIHDELLFEVKKECMKEIATTVKKAMESCCVLKAKLQVSLKIGVSWGSLQCYVP